MSRLSDPRMVLQDLGTLGLLRTTLLGLAPARTISMLGRDLPGDGKRAAIVGDAPDRQHQVENANDVAVPCPVSALAGHGRDTDRALVDLASSPRGPPGTPRPSSCGAGTGLASGGLCDRLDGRCGG
jgi:hypothetical protein